MPQDPTKPVFIFDTHGDWQAVKFGNYLWSTRAEYIGYLDGEDVYKRDGEWIGRLSKDGRILRKRTEMRRELATTFPKEPARPEKFPARAPLPPMMAELSYSIVDVLEEEPDIFRKISDLRPDMD